MSTLQDLIGLILAGLMAIIGYFTRDLVEKNKILEDKINGLHEVYVRKDDFKEFKEELWRRLDELRDIRK